MMPGKTEFADRFGHLLAVSTMAFAVIFGQPRPVSAQPSCVIAPPGLISWWNAEGSAVDITSGNNGLASGNVAYGTGEVGGAFRFDGTAGTCVRIPYAASLTSPAYTLEAWVNPLAPISDPANQKVLFAQNKGRAQLVVQPGSTGLRVVFQFFNSPNSWSVLKSSIEIPFNQFSHLAATWDGTTQRLYINGVLNAQANPGATPWDSGCDYFIGGINSLSSAASCQYAGQFFQGLIDEICYYRRPLSASEIRTIFDAGAAGKCPQPEPVIPLAGPVVSPKTFAFDLERRDPSSGQKYLTRQVFRGSDLAMIVMDVWDSHPDPEMASRASALIPRLNEALDAARALGIKIIFCPNEVPLPASANISAFAGLPNQPQMDNGFNPSLPSYSDASSGDMVPILYDVAYGPRFPVYTRQHPELLIRPPDLASISRQQIFNYCAAHGITHLLYVGVAANMCVCWSRETSMIPMKRYCGLEPILVRDLTDSMTLNGRRQTGVNDSSNNTDLTMTPDLGHRQVVDQDETSICSSIDARQLLQYWPTAAYANLVTGDANLLCCWPMDSKADYQEILDAKRNQSCWWNRNDLKQMTGLNFNVSGAIAIDLDTALQFLGSTILVSPLYRDDIPTNSPLVSLSSTNFTLETWVRFDALNSNQWFYAHDNGLSNGVDVLFGLNSSNHFQVIVGSQISGYGDVLESVQTVTQDDVSSKRWFHVVAIHDVNQAVVSLYVNGSLDSYTNHSCTPVALVTAPHLGSRGLATLGRSRYLASSGFEFLYGSLDEFAIYSAALSPNTIALHVATAQGQWNWPFIISASPQQQQLLLNWPSWPLGLRLQTSDDLSNWSFSNLPVSETNGICQVSVPTARRAAFFRLSLP